ncbi:MAG TPA: Rid family detoxifying hydrolase [Candidatus Limnocylindria bacterium]|nr:Rid family detoxifying hydrolase [Candidatus Limnocylindria bacterium]
MTKREVIKSAKVPATGLPYAQAIRVGDLVFVAGQVALDPATGKAMEGDVTAQTEAVIGRISWILEDAGTSLKYAVEHLCFLADIRRDFAAFNAVYAKYFDVTGPARTTVQAVLPREGLLVEIRCVAAMPPA